MEIVKAVKTSGKAGKVVIVLLISAVLLALHAGILKSDKLTGFTGACFSDSKTAKLSFQAVGARSDYIHACRCRNKVCIKNVADFNILVVTSNCGISNHVLYPGERLCVYQNTTVTFVFEDSSKLTI